MSDRDKETSLRMVVVWCRLHLIASTLAHNEEWAIFFVLSCCESTTFDDPSTKH